MGNDTSVMPLRPSQTSPLTSSFSQCFTELSIATVHKDRAITHAIFVGSNTIATCGDDPSVHIWDAGTLTEVSTLPDVSCKATMIACVTNDMLVTAHESDRTACLWNLSQRSNPECIRKWILPIENPDDSTRFVHRIIALDGGWFATAYWNVSDDRWLYIWNDSGVLVTRIERQDGCKLNDMLYMRVSDCSCLVTCHEPFTPCSNLYIYKNINEADAAKRDCPQIACTELFGAVVMLHRVNCYTFASGSADGSVILWEHAEGASEPQFRPRELRRCETQSRNPTNDWRVRQMENVHNSMYLLVAIGFGFLIFHVESGAALLQLENVHDNFVSHVVVIDDDDVDSVGSLNSSTSATSSKSGEKSLDAPSPVKDIAAAAKSVIDKSSDKRSDFERLQKIILVSVSGCNFYVWRLMEANFKRTNTNPKVKKPKQQPKFKNAVEPEACHRLDAVFVQNCAFPSIINAIVTLSPFCSLVSFHNNGDLYCWRTTENAVDGAAISALSLCSHTSLGEIIALWFESDSHFDNPGSNFLVPLASSAPNVAESDLDVTARLKPSIELDKKQSTAFEYSSLPPGIPHYIFENVVELIKDNESHEDILAILKAGEHSEAIVACVEAFLKTQTEPASH